MLFNRRTFLRNVELVPKVFTPVRQCSGLNQNELKVKIPKRIERSPTDILKALATTVKVDTTAFPYKFPDDPYFYADSAFHKRSLALSLESGRKSAKSIVKSNPGFFKNVLSEPPIEAFLIKPQYDNKSDNRSKVTEETLVKEISKRNIENAITVYDILLGDGIIISDDVKQNLLELVCFYNSENKADTEELEFKWFANVEKNSLEVNTWQKQGFAESLFEGMDQNCPLANSAIIQGMIKFNDVQRAFEIYSKAKSNNVKFSLGVYNALLSQAANSNIDIGDGVAFIEKLLKEMAEANIQPDIGTLNSCLKSLMHLQRIKRNNNFVKKLFMEFVHVGVEPSLGSYHYLFRIFGTSRRMADRNNLFLQLLELVDGRKHEVRHPSDFLFFQYSMNLFASKFQSAELVDRLHSILLQHDNMKFIENSLTESQYYKEYLAFAFKCEPLEVAMRKFKNTVPSLYSPEVSIYSVMLSAIVSSHSIEHLVEFWEELKKLRASKMQKLLAQILPLVQVFEDEAALKIAYEAAINVQEYHEDDKSDWKDQKIVSLVLITFLKMGDVERALKVYDEVKEFGKRSPLLSEDAVMEIFRYALSEKNVRLMVELMKYAEYEFYSEVSQMAEMALPLLGESDKVWATGLIKRTEESGESKKESEEESSKNPQSGTDVDG